MLFAVWTDEVHRPTKDLDLLGLVDDSAERLTILFRQICQVEVDPDGLVFDPTSVRAEEIREDQEYQEQRITLTGFLGKARVPIQIDIGFGDVIAPDAEEIVYPTLLALPPPRIRAYPKETVVSEKLQAMIFFGMVNSRMKDFYDLWVMSRQFLFNGITLVDAILATFERRRTPIPEGTPTALSEHFANNMDKANQRKAFLSRTGLGDADIPLNQVVEGLQAFLLPPLIAAAKGNSFTMSWKDSGPWSAG
jgi:hypothetical protein